MADSTVELLATARDAISDTLKKVSRGLSETGDSAREAAVESAELERVTESLEREFTDFSKENVKTISTIREMTSASDELKDEMGLTGRAAKDLDKTLREMRRSEQDTVLTTETLQSTLRELAEEGTVTERSVEAIEDEMGDLNKRVLNSIVHVDEFRDQIEKMANDMFEADIGARELSRALGTIANANDIQSVDTFADQVEKMAISEGVAENQAEQLADAIRQLSTEALTEFGPASQATIANLLGIEHAADEAEDEIEELGREYGTLERKMVSWNATAILSQLTLMGLREHGDNAADKFMRLQETFSELLPENPITTLNLGPVNISLAHMFTTVVTLTTVLGPLISTVGALATALGALASVVFSFLGLGLLDFLDQIENRFASIENRAEAMEALMSGLARAARDALSPIMDESIGGMGPTEFFIETIRFGMDILRDFALIVEDLTSGESGEAIANFFERIGEALTSGDDGVEFVDALETAVADVLPLITDFVVFLINNLPEMIKFMSQVAEDVGPAFANIFLTILPGLVELVKLGEDIFEILSLVTEKLAAIIGVAMAAFGALDSMVPVDLAEFLREIGAVIVVVTFALMSFVGAITTVIGLFSVLPIIGKAVFGILSLLIGNVGTLTGALGTLGGAVGTLSSLLSPVVAAILAIVAAVASLIWMFLNMGDTVEFLNDIYGGLHDTFSNFLEQLGLTAEQADLVTDALFTLAMPLFGLKLLFEEILALDDDFASIFTSPIDALLNMRETVQTIDNEFSGFVDTLSDVFEWIGLNSDIANILAEAVTAILFPIYALKLAFEGVLALDDGFDRIIQSLQELGSIIGFIGDVVLGIGVFAIRTFTRAVLSMKNIVLMAGGIFGKLVDILVGMFEWIGRNAEVANTLTTAITAMLSPIYALRLLLGVLIDLGTIFKDIWEDIDSTIDNIVSNVQELMQLWQDGQFGSNLLEMGQQSFSIPELFQQQQSDEQSSTVPRRFQQQQSDGQQIINISVENPGQDGNTLRRLIRDAINDAGRRQSNRTGSRTP